MMSFSQWQRLNIACLAVRFTEDFRKPSSETGLVLRELSELYLRVVLPFVRRGDRLTGSVRIFAIRWCNRFAPYWWMENVRLLKHRLMMIDAHHQPFILRADVLDKTKSSHALFLCHYAVFDRKLSCHFKDKQHFFESVYFTIDNTNYFNWNLTVNKNNKTDFRELLATERVDDHI